jgi:putative tricarboxylic transport membrane protein
VPVSGRPVRSSRETEPGAEAGARKRLNTDTAAGGIGFAFALAYLAAAFTIPEGSFSNAAVGPAVLPIVIGAALAVASLALAARGVLRGAPVENDPEGAEELDDNPAQSPARFAVVAGLLLGYILLFLPLGYVVSTFLFLFGTTMYLDRGRPVRNVVYSLLFALIVYYVFTELLTVVLPAGPLSLGLV